MDGRCFPPFVIFKGESNTKNGKIATEVKNPKCFGYTLMVLYAVQEKAWIDKDRMMKFIDW